MPHKNIYKSIAVDGQQYRRRTETTKMQDLIASELEFSFEKMFFSLLVSENSYQATT